MKKLTEDKLDEINRSNSMRGNIVKWWNVNMGSAEQNEEQEEEVLAEDNKELYENILKENHRMEDVFEHAMQDIKQGEEEHIEKANLVYERLMEEARLDEEKKLQEIKMAKIIADNNENEE